MSKPISTEELIRFREFCRRHTMESGKSFRILDELINARAEIAELKRLSASHTNPEGSK